MAITVAELEQLENTIRAGLAAFIETGEAIAKIKRTKAYELRGYQSLEDYCEKEFHFSMRHGQRLILAARAARKVEQITGEVPHNESVVRQFAKVLDRPDAEDVIKDVLIQLNREGVTMTNATAEVMARAVEHVIHPKPTTRSNLPTRYIGGPMLAGSQARAQRPAPGDTAKSTWPKVRAAAQVMCDVCETRMQTLHDKYAEPAWLLITQTANTVCNQCNVREVAGACSACPGVELLKNLMLATK